MRFFKYLNQKVRNIGEKKWKIFKGFFKNKQEKNRHIEIEFHNSIQD